MNLNKQILEAIQRGINLAIDDFDDDIVFQKTSQIKNNIHTKELLQWVDLGLPSKTLWHKYNVGVNPDKLEKAKDWYGNYYTFDEANNLKEYILPTQEQIQELIDETTSEWIRNYKGIKGLNGRVFVGKNGKGIFIPAAGYSSGSSLYDTGAYCRCWSSSLYLPDSLLSYYLRFNFSNISLNASSLYYGLPSRPVLD